MLLKINDTGRGQSGILYHLNLHPPPNVMEFSEEKIKDAFYLLFF